jgi:hypothetical protein
MDPLKIKPSATSLNIFLDAQSGQLSFSGRSISEHSIEFFRPVIDWIERYSVSPAQKTECIFQLEYFNSAARKSLIEIFKRMQDMHKKGQPVSVFWHYEEGDEGMKELGEEYASLFTMPFRFKEGFTE